MPRCCSSSSIRTSPRHIYDDFYPWHPGGGIYVLENPAEPPASHRLRPVIDATTNETLGEGVYRDPDLSWDAQQHRVRLQAGRRTPSPASTRSASTAAA